MFAALNSFQVGGKPTLVSDVFSTSLYTGNGSTQTITNGIDLSTKGGLVWCKNRTTGGSSTGENALFDTARGNGRYLSSDLTDAQANWANTWGVTSFNTNGFGVTDSGGSFYVNGSSQNYASWTFREQAKFFDIVTWTGNGTNQTVNHSLGSIPGCIIYKRTDSTSDWFVSTSNSAGNYEFLKLNTTAASVAAANPSSIDVTATSFDPLRLWGNVNGATYVAYLFAHDAGGFGASGADNVISCGSTSGTKVTLGYEPQWILYKSSNFVEDWQVVDSQRGMPAASPAQLLKPNTSDAETTTSNNITIASDGFTLGAVTGTVIYIAIKAS